MYVREVKSYRYQALLPFNDTFTVLLFIYIFSHKLISFKLLLLNVFKDKKEEGIFIEI